MLFLSRQAVQPSLPSHIEGAFEGEEKEGQIWFLAFVDRLKLRIVEAHTEDLLAYLFRLYKKDGFQTPSLSSLLTILPFPQERCTEKEG